MVREGRREINVWVDTQTHDLLEVVDLLKLEGSGILKVVSREFRFNDEFDESRFSYEVPAGYNVYKAEMPEVVLIEDVNGELPTTK